MVRPKRVWTLDPLTPCCTASVRLGLPGLVCTLDSNHVMPDPAVSRWATYRVKAIPLGVDFTALSSEAPAIRWWLEDVWSMDPLLSEVAYSDLLDFDPESAAHELEG